MRWVSLAAGITVTATVVLGASQPEVHAEYGGTIREYIRMLMKPGDDRVMVISRDGGAELIDERPSVTEALQILTRFTDVIAVVDVAEVSTEIAEEGTWIRSRLRGRVAEVLRSKPGLPRALPAGAPLDLYDRHGEMVVDGVRVRAGYSPALPPARRYLVFASYWYPDYREDTMYCVPLLVDQGRLVRTWPPESVAPAGEPITTSRNELHEVLVGQTVADIKRRLARIR